MNALIINCSPVKTGATAEIVRIASQRLRDRYTVRDICIDDFKIDFCKGCRTCHSTARCVQQDGMGGVMGHFEWADVIVCVSPSYWADVPGQFKAFIDRCTPWSNTHQPHASIGGGKKGYAIALRTGPGMPECERLIGSIGHFYGHLDVEFCGGLGLCSVERREDAVGRADEIAEFCGKI